MWDYLPKSLRYFCSLRTYTNKAKPLTYWSGDKPLSLISLMNLLISSQSSLYSQVSQAILLQDLPKTSSRITLILIFSIILFI